MDITISNFFIVGVYEIFGNVASQLLENCMISWNTQQTEDVWYLVDALKTVR